MDDLKKEIEQLRERIEVLENMAHSHTILRPKEIKTAGYEDLVPAFGRHDTTA